MCYKAEHTKHIVAGCTILAPSEYTNRHNRVAGYIHWMICKHMGLQVTDRYYEHIPEKGLWCDVGPDTQGGPLVVRLYN